MNIELNHTIIHTKRNFEVASFYSDVFGFSSPKTFSSYFWVVETSNRVTLAFMNIDEPIQAQHYAFLVNEADFDAIFERLKKRSLPYWADPDCEKPHEVNRDDGGRGVYFKDPEGHILEIITRPYGHDKASG